VKKGVLLRNAVDDELGTSNDEDAGLGANGDGSGAEYLRWRPGNDADRPRTWENVFMGTANVSAACSAELTGLVDSVGICSNPECSSNLNGGGEKPAREDDIGEAK